MLITGTATPMRMATVSSTSSTLPAWRFLGGAKGGYAYGPGWRPYGA